MPVVIRMNGAAIKALTELIKPFVMHERNGREMMTEMESAKIIRILLKEFGSDFVITYADSGVYTKNTSISMPLFFNGLLTTSD